MVFEYLSHKMLDDYSRKAPEYQVVNSLLPIRRLKCHNYDGDRPTWFAVVKSLEFVQIEAIQKQNEANKLVSRLTEKVRRPNRHQRLTIANKFEHHSQH